MGSGVTSLVDVLSDRAPTIARVWKKIPASNLTDLRPGATVRLDEDEPDKVLASAVLRDDGSGEIDVTFTDGSVDIADSLSYVDVQG